MKYIDDYRDGAKAAKLSEAIHREADPAKRYNFMEFCGGHTHAISRYGIEDLLPDSVKMIHGPGCPVCVLPVGRIDDAIWIAKQPGVILCTYGDMMRVPGSKRVSLLKAKADGADVRMVYSTMDAIAVAEENPDKHIVFFAIGFETTTPPTAMGITLAKKKGVKNISFFCNHVLTPSAIQNILESREVRELGTLPLDGFVGPAHVSVVIGSGAYEWFAEEYQKPVVIAGFEPLDVLQAILMLVRQMNDGRSEVENQYTRAVTRDGNLKAQEMVSDVFELRSSFEWRGLGTVPYSALKIREAYGEYDAERRFDVPGNSVPDPKSCECSAIIRGLKKPVDCKLFGTVCTPETPIGSCMVSSEGSCAAHYTYGRFRDANKVAAQ